MVLPLIMWILSNFANDNSTGWKRTWIYLCPPSNSFEFLAEFIWQHSYTIKDLCFFKKTKFCKYHFRPFVTEKISWLISHQTEIENWRFLKRKNLNFTNLGFSCFSQQPILFFKTSTRNLVVFTGFKNLILGHISRQKWNQLNLLISKQKNAPKGLKVLNPQRSWLASPPKLWD